MHLVLQVAEALRMHHEETLAEVQDRHKRMARVARLGTAVLGLKSQCASMQRRSTTLTAITLPPELPPARVRDGLKARGILTAAGLDRYQPSSFRIGHMGDIREDDVRRTIDALKEVIAELRA